MLTTVEVHQLLQDQGVDFASLPESLADVLLPNEDNESGQWGLPGGAGGFLEYSLRCVAPACWAQHSVHASCEKHRFVAKEVLGHQLPPGPLATRALRNADMREVVVPLTDDALANGHATLRCAAAYGFRNIQTTVRKVKRNACEYQFVEVMACPGACNAGALFGMQCLLIDVLHQHDVCIHLYMVYTRARERHLCACRRWAGTPTARGDSSGPAGQGRGSI